LGNPRSLCRLYPLFLRPPLRNTELVIFFTERGEGRGALAPLFKSSVPLGPEPIFFPISVSILLTCYLPGFPPSSSGLETPFFFHLHDGTEFYPHVPSPPSPCLPRDESPLPCCVFTSLIIRVCLCISPPPPPRRFLLFRPSRCVYCDFFLLVLVRFAHDLVLRSSVTRELSLRSSDFLPDNKFMCRSFSFSILMLSPCLPLEGSSGFPRVVAKSLTFQLIVHPFIFWVFF